MKFVTNTLLLSSLLIGSAGAVTVAMDRGTTTGMVVVNANSTTTDPALGTTSRVAIGSLVRWGTMSGVASAANFVQFATTTVNNVNTTTLSTVGGSIRDSIEIAGTSSVIANVQVYMWVYNASTAASATADGLFTSTAWKPGADFATDGSATFTFVLGQNQPTSAAGPLVTTLATARGTASVTVGAIRNSTAGAENPAGFVYKLAAIPEPSAAALGAIGALCLLRRRRN